FRSGARFDNEERLAAEAAVAHLALAVRAFEPRSDRPTLDRGGAVELLGEALAAGEDGNEGGVRLARIGALATGATAALLWLADEARGPVWVASHGSSEPSAELEAIVAEVLAGRSTVRLEQPAAGGNSLATIRLGEPPLGALQLVFTEHAVPDEAEL